MNVYYEVVTYKKQLFIINGHGMLNVYCEREINFSKAILKILFILLLYALGVQAMMQHD